MEEQKQGPDMEAVFTRSLQEVVDQRKEEIKTQLREKEAQLPDLAQQAVNDYMKELIKAGCSDREIRRKVYKRFKIRFTEDRS